MRPSKGTLSSEKSTDSAVATPKVWAFKARPATTMLSWMMSPWTLPVPYVTWNGWFVSLNVDELWGPRKVWLP